jgi:proline iminopeptidase
MRLFVLLVALLQAPVSAWYVSVPPRMDNLAPIHGKGGYVNTPAGRVYYEAEGQGTPIVLIAGGPGGTHADFHPWFGRLSRRFQVVYFDNLGRGRSDRLEDLSHYTVERDAEDVEALRVALGHEQIYVFGYSYGGLPALAYAIKYPNRVRGLILSDTIHSARGWQESIDGCNAYVQHQYPDTWEELMDMRRAGTNSSSPAYRDLYERCLVDIRWKHAESQAKMPALEEASSEGNSEIYTALIGPDPAWKVGGTLIGYDPRPRMKGLRVPTLSCVGRHDRVTTPKQAKEIQAALPEGVARLVIFEESGHRPYVEETERYFDVIEDFLVSASVRPLSQTAPGSRRRQRRPGVSLPCGGKV